MNRFSFGKGVLLAAALSVLGAALYGALHPLWSAGVVLKGVLTLLGGAYSAVLMQQIGLRTGRVALPVAWLLAAAAIAWWSSSLLAFIVLHSVLMWFTRALCWHKRALSVLLDGLLCALAILAALVSAGHSASMLVSVWSYFLVQALFVFIPRDWHATDPQQDRNSQTGVRFDQALKRAEAAVRRINTAH